MSRYSSGNSSSSASKKRGRPDPRKPLSSSKNPRPHPATASWSFNSPSSFKSSSRKSPFSDFGSYMVEKNRKLREQFDSDASGSGGGSGIFCGVSIFVDGFTVPSNQELKGYMLKHGGHFENYFSKRRVTHIICSNLPDSKLKNFRTFSRGLPVVKPTWILDSVDANKLLSWVPYQLYEGVNEMHRQQKLSVFFMSKKNGSFKDAHDLVNINEISGSGSKSSDSDNHHLPTKSEESEESLDSVQENICDQNDTHGFHNDQTIPLACPNGMGLKSFTNQNIVRESTVGSSDCSKHLHSTQMDPNFVKNYFKKSRLHFIGTWRSRYRKRFLDKSSEAETIEKNLQSVSTSRKSSIIHIDMDCFFVSVILRNRPELIDKPVAVCHSDNPKGTAEISSANYPAREYGIKAGMFVGAAKALCPDLVTFPYDFDAYEEVADQFYAILHKHCHKVQAISCDEAFLDITNVHEEPERVASMIRDEIAQTTRCTASAGIAENLLLARLATRSAKPNGQCFIPSDKVEGFLKDLPIQELPGIGHSLKEKLKAHEVQTCGQLRLLSKDLLKKDFGSKIGDMLWSYCRGIDNRMVESVQEIKSVGAEVNWGVRFKDLKDCHNFLASLCEEVSLRLQGCGMQGRSITLKVKKRREGADEPIKYMGCGECINISRSSTVAIATDSAESLQRISRQLFASFHVDVKEIRGIGLQISRLEHASITKLGHAERSLETWLSPASGHTRYENSTILRRSQEPLSASGGHQGFREHEIQHIGKLSARYAVEKVGPESSSSLGQPRNCSSGSEISGLPPLCHLDIDVIKSLPPEIVAEFNAFYNGGLSDVLLKFSEADARQSHSMRSSSSLEADSTLPCEKKEVELENIIEFGNCVESDKDIVSQDKGKRPLIYPTTSISTGHLPVFKETSSEGSLGMRISEIGEGGPILFNNFKRNWRERPDLVPSSLSQIDVSVLKQLPEDVKADIIGALPAHGKTESSDVRPVQACGEMNYIGEAASHHVDLWEGDPPRWVHAFRSSNCLMLSILAEAFLQNGMSGLSSLLPSLVAALPSLHLNENEWDEAFSGLSKLLIQYIKRKIGTDIEEVYVCFSLLKRFAQKSQFFAHVHDQLLPSVQDCVGEVYGGKLKFSAINS